MCCCQGECRHCFLSPSTATVSCHQVPPLFPVIKYRHCFLSPSTATVSCHQVPTLFPVTKYRHCSLSPSITKYRHCFLSPSITKYRHCVVSPSTATVSCHQVPPLFRVTKYRHCFLSPSITKYRHCFLSPSTATVSCHQVPTLFPVTKYRHCSLSPSTRNKLMGRMIRRGERNFKYSKWSLSSTTFSTTNAIWTGPCGAKLATDMLNHGTALSYGFFFESRHSAAWSSVEGTLYFHFLPWRWRYQVISQQWYQPFRPANTSPP